MTTFLFYDIETTGLNKAFDQVLQFAAIRTDEEFNELNRYNFIVKLRPDIIPSASAMITHRIPISKLSDGITEYEAITKIYELLNQPNTISLGYNSLGFDDEFLRFSMFRNLLNPYSHQYMNGCKRADILPIAVAFRLFDEKILNWPIVNEKLSMKLEQINKLNNLAGGVAHDALADVEATVELAKVFSKNKKMWQYFLEFFDKEKDKKKFESLSNLKMNEKEFPYGIMLMNSFGSKSYFHSPVIYLGKSVEYSNQFLWLKLDDEKISSAKPETFNDLWVIRKTLGGAEFVLPAEEKTSRFLSDERKTLANENIKYLRKNPDALKEIVEYFKNFKYKFYENVDVDATLYMRGFFTKDEQDFMNSFRLAKLEQKHKLLQYCKSDDLRTLGARVFHRNFSEIVKNNKALEQLDIDDDNYGSFENIIDFTGKQKLTPAKALEEIKQLSIERELDLEQKNILNELEEYIKLNF